MTPLDQASQVMAAPPAFKPLPMKAPQIGVERRADGSVLIWSTHEPAEAPRSIGQLLAERAAAFPGRAYLRQREPGHGPWRTVTYGEARRRVEGIAQWLLDRGLTGADSVMILSAN